MTAAVVVLTGLVGANFVQVVLDKLQFRDPIARGIATASRCETYYTNQLPAITRFLFNSAVYKLQCGPL